METVKLRKRMCYPVAGVLAMAGLASAQMNFSSFYTQTVKTGQPWAQIDTKINSLDLKVEVNRGVVTTRATFEYTPSVGYRETYSDCAPTLCQREITDSVKSVDPVACPDVCELRVTRDTIALDSLETNANFTLPLNSVITDMTLWVGETPVKAALQERALASAQYESIVKRRRDPALLESWGNGNYLLRIFPGKSSETRKLQVEFVQGIENDGDRVSTVLPVIMNLAKVYASTTTQAEYDKLPYRTIGSVNVEAVSLDGKTYDFDLPGVGTGKVSSTPLKLEAKNVNELKEGRVSIAAASCVTCLTPWTARHGSAEFFGAKATLVGKNLKFGEEPVERHVVVDVAASSVDPNVVDRARKIALLSLKAYAAEPFKGTLGFADGEGAIRYVFDRPVSMGTEELAKAYEALVAWRPAKRSGAEAALTEFAQSRSNAIPACVLYLVNNDTTPYFNYGGEWSEAIQNQYQKYEQTMAKQDSVLAETLKKANAMLFGFWNNYHLSQIAAQTGGFQIGSMYQYGFYPTNYLTRSVVDTVGQSPEMQLRNMQLPPLFGPGRYNTYSIADLKVTPKNGSLSNLVVNQGSYPNYGLLLGGVMVEDMPMGKRAARVSGLAKSAASVALGYRVLSPDTLDIRLAGNYLGSGRVTVELTGLWGGLRFTTEVELELLALGSEETSKGAGIWASLKGEEIGLNYSEADIKAIQDLGKEFHIVNRQMSLLALEPGMELWTEMPSKTGQSNVVNAEMDASVPTTDGLRAANPSASVDNISLEAILKDFVPILKGASARITKVGGISQRLAGNRLELFWSVEGAPEAATFRIVQMSGREVARLSGSRGQKGFAATWQLPARHGTYWVIAKSGKHTRIQAINLAGSAF